MWNNPKSSLSIVALVLVFLACSKSEPPTVTPPTVTPPPGKDSTAMGLNLAYMVNPNNTMGTFEAIVTNASGTVLLDTVATVNTKIVTVFKSDTKLIDLTIIHYLVLPKRYDVTTYKAVDPTGWGTIGYDLRFPRPAVPGATPAGFSHVTYINPPVNAGQPYFNNFSDSFLTSVSVMPTTLEVDYQRYPANFNYIMFPDKGLYKFTPANKALDTVDLSTMEQGRLVDFVRPARYTRFFNEMQGVMDTTDDSKTLMLFHPPSMYTGHDLVVPVSKVQKYHVSGAFFGDLYKGFFSFDSYGDTVITTLDLPSLEDVSFNTATPDLVSLQFNRKMTYYQVHLFTASNLAWDIYASADSTILKPLPYLRGLKAKLLGTVDLTTLNPNAFIVNRSMDGRPFQRYVNDMLGSPTPGQRRDGVTVSMSTNF